MLKSKLQIIRSGMPKPLTVILLTVGLIIGGMIITSWSGGSAVSCQCYVEEGQQCPPCENPVANAIMAAGFVRIAAGAALPVMALMAARKNANQIPRQ